MGSRVSTETLRSMSGFSNGGDQIEAVFVFGEEYVGFQGHFPERKVLPGVCQVQCVLAMLGTWKGREARLREISLAKYYLPVGPLEGLAFRCFDIRETADGCSVRAVAMRGGEKVSDFKLVAAFGTEKKRA